jgi:hypothetical protein
LRRRAPNDVRNYPRLPSRDEIPEGKDMRRTLIIAITVFVAAAQAKDQPQLTIEVLKAETVHWTTYLHDNGSA